MVRLSPTGFNYHLPDAAHPHITNDGNRLLHELRTFSTPKISKKIYTFEVARRLGKIRNEIIS